jgi:hypothetical protein
MTLQASGTISLTDVMNEIRLVNPGRAYPISMGDADVRALAGVPSGPIGLSNLYSKSSYIPMNVTGNGDSHSAYSGVGGNSPVTCHPSVSVTNGSGGYTYSWSFTSNPQSCALNATTSAACNVSHTFSINANGTASATLQCIVTDSTGHSVTATGITADLDWGN